MKKTFLDFFAGVTYVFRGCKAFYCDLSAWKYSICPICLMVLFYVLLFAGIFWLTGIAVDYAVNCFEQVPEYMKWFVVVVRWGIWISCVLISVLVLLGTVTLLYEFFGGLFFDALTDYYEKKTFGTEAVKSSLKQNVKFIIDTILFALWTLSVLLFFIVLGFFFPLFGQILTIFIMGYYLAVSCMMSSAFRNGMQLADLRRAARGRIALLTGFGSMAYLLMLLPFLSILLLPGLVLGGAELRRQLVMK